MFGWLDRCIILASLSSEYSYLDLNKCEWHIIPSCTKNKVERIFKVPQEWIDLIRLVDDENKLKKRWLLYVGGIPPIAPLFNLWFKYS